MEGRTEGVHGNKKKWAQRTWRLDAAMDAMTALTIKGVARATLRLSLGYKCRANEFSRCSGSEPPD